MKYRTYTVKNQDGEALDHICYRIYGNVKDYWSLVMEVNPGIADHGDILPFGVEINLPDVAKKKAAGPVKIWE